MNKGEVFCLWNRASLQSSLESGGLEWSEAVYSTTKQLFSKTVLWKFRKDVWESSFV